MFIVRVNYKNGQHLEYLYAGGDGLGRAQATMELLVTAQKAALQGKPVLCEPWDDAGRNGSIIGTDIQTVQLVDVTKEAIGAVHLKMLCEAVARKHDPSFQPQRPNGASPGFDPVTGERSGQETPAIGRGTPTFSS